MCTHNISFHGGKIKIKVSYLEINPFMLSRLFHLNSLDQSIFSLRGSSQFWLLPCFIEMPVVNANSVGADQMPHFAASDLVYTANIPFKGC